MHLGTSVSRKTTSYNSGNLLTISIELERSNPAKVGASKFLDTLGSSMSNLISHGGFVSNTASRGNKEVSILLFEVANTIVKGSNLMQSLSEENIQILRKEILHSEGVQLLVSTDIKELLSIAAADKREEFEDFKKEVVRFGDMCKDPQWHNLDRLFRSGYIRQPLSYLKNSQKRWFDPLFSFSQNNRSMNRDLHVTMQELANMAQHTSELYHEYETLDRLERYYQRKLEEVESLHLPRKGKNLLILQDELRYQRKLVRNLKKKSPWSKSLEEVVDKLVDGVGFINQTIPIAFEDATSSTMNHKRADKEPERLGVAGLDLHYANLIMQISCIASRPTSLTSNMRDTLYSSLPASVKSDLRSSLQPLDSPEVMTVTQVKAEIDKTLNWLVSLATDTIKASQGFGFVGEWANTGNEFGTKRAGGNNIIRLQTLYHADKQTMDLYILDLIVWLHRLINLTRCRDDLSASR